MKKVHLAMAIGLVIVWIAMFLAIPLTLDLFRTVKIEMPDLTMLMIAALHFAGGLALLTLVLATAILLHLRQSAGWAIALFLCGACDLAGVALVLPLIALMNVLRATLVSPVLYFGSSPGVWLAAVAVILNQILFILLLQKRRDFWVQPRTGGSLLPIK